MNITLFRDLSSENWPSMDRYAESLAAALPAVLPVGWSVQMPLPPDRQRGPRQTLFARLLTYPLWARSRQGEINHVVDHSYGHLLFMLDSRRTVVTVHDVAALHFPGRRFGLSGLAWDLAWRGIQRARHIIVDSDFIARELQAHLCLSPDRYYRVPLAVSSQFRPPPEDVTAQMRHRYAGGAAHVLLHVGHTQPRKNIPTLLQAVCLLRDRGLNVRLIQVGGVPTTDQRALIAELGLDEAVHFAGSVPFSAESDLSAFYGMADVFVFPSLYEGFGMPVLEAMACGTVVVAGDASSLPEVVGEAGLLADPTSADAIATTVARVLTDEALAQTLRAKGKARAAAFSWAQTAQCAALAYGKVREGL